MRPLLPDRLVSFRPPYSRSLSLFGDAVEDRSKAMEPTKGQKTAGIRSKEIMMGNTNTLHF